MDDGVEHMLTTIDNPWNPFTQWDEWYAYDREKGYDTPGFLARVCKFSFDLSDADQDLVIEQAIEEIVRMNISGIYRSVPDPRAAEKIADPGGAFAN